MGFELKELNDGKKLRHIKCAYDEDRFEIRVNENNEICLYSKKDNRLLDVFGHRNVIEFICQTDSKKGTFFYVSSVLRENSKKSYSLTCYSYLESYPNIDTNNPGYLYENCRYNICSPFYDSINLSDKAFIIEGNINGGRIISRKTGKVSDRFTKILNHYGDSNIAYVERVIKSNIPEVCDYVYYGIDLDTLESDSDIYSKNQDRFIPLLTKEEIKKNPEKVETLSRYGFDNPDFTYNQLEATIALEIKEKLRKEVELLLEKIGKNNNNFDFIKKLGTYPKEEK